MSIPPIRPQGPIWVSPRARQGPAAIRPPRRRLSAVALAKTEARKIGSTLFEEMRDVAVELRGVLEEGEMADVGLDQEARAGGPVRHDARLVVVDHLVVVGIDDPGRHLDLREIRFRPVRL